MKQLLSLTLLILMSSFIYGQKLDAKLKPGVNESYIYTTLAGTDSRPCVYIIPKDYYNKPTKNFPVVVFGHGIGSKGTDTITAASGGLAYVARGSQPIMAIGNNDTIRPIIVCPQDPTYSPRWQQFPGIIKFISQNFRTDTTRYYLAGLSAGGDITLDAIANTTDKRYIKYIAAVRGSSLHNNTLTWDSLVRYKREGIALLLDYGMLSSDDNFRPQTVRAYNTLKNFGANVDTLIFRNYGHDHFSERVANNFRPAKLGYKNVWEWFYQFKRQPSTTTTPTTYTPVRKVYSILLSKPQSFTILPGRDTSQLNINIQAPAPVHDTVYISTPPPILDTVKPPVIETPPATVDTGIKKVFNKYYLPYTDATAKEVYRPKGLNFSLAAGDTIALKGYYSDLQLGFINGTYKDKVVITAEGETVVDRLLLSNSSYFKIVGKEFNLKIGKVNGNVGLGVSMSHDYEIAYLEIRNAEAGLICKKNPDSLIAASVYPNSQDSNIYIHHLYVHNTKNEGMYIGHTYPYKDPYNPSNGLLTPTRMKNVEISNCIIDSTDWDGIQVSNARENCRIHDNIVSNYGLANISGQQAGIILGANTTGVIYNNTVSNGTGNAIQVFGYGFVDVFKNTIENTGRDGTLGGLESFYAASRVSKIELNPKLSISFRENYIINPILGRGLANVNAEQEEIPLVNYLNNKVASSLLPAGWETSSRYFGSGATVTNRLGNYLSK